MPQWMVFCMFSLLMVTAANGNRLTLTNEDAEKLLDHFKNYGRVKPFGDDFGSLKSSPSLSSQEVEDLVIPLGVDDCLPMGEDKLPKQLEDSADVWDVEEFHLADAEGASTKFKKNHKNSDFVYPLDSSENALSSLVQEVLPVRSPVEPKVSAKRDYAFGCDCKIKNTVIDLGVMHYPRYLLNAVCHNGKHPPKCRAGTVCRALDYKVTVLAWRTDYKNRKNKDRISRGLWLPEDLKRYALKTITVAAGCVCAF